MDDDAPLSALAKAPKIDDDTPLVALADANKKAKASPKPGAVKPKGKAKATPKKKGSDSDSSSSSSSDSSSDSDSAVNEKTRPKKAAAKRAAPLKRKSTDLEMADNATKKKDRSPKEALVAELLCRWWYALPPWPPEDDAYYEEELKKRSLRRVKIEEWEWVPEVDAKGLRKVYGLTQYRGLYRSSTGELVDVRPQATCPCFTNFMKKDMPELADLLVTAYEGQIKALLEAGGDNKLESEIQASLTKARNSAYKAKQVGAVKMRK